LLNRATATYYVIQNQFRCKNAWRWLNGNRTINRGLTFFLCFAFQFKIVSSSRRMHYHTRTRWLRREGRVNGNCSSSARRNSRRASLRAVVEEEQPRTVGLPRSTGRCCDAGRKYGTVVASGPEASLQAGRDLQGGRIDLESRSDGWSPEDQRASYCHCNTADQRRNTTKVW